VTGGEPMLYPKLVEHILNYDFGRPMRFTIKTNGFWGKDTAKARKFLEKYKEKWKNISLSYDEFHKEYIDVGNIKNIIRIASDLEINTEVVGGFLKTGIRPGDILNELGECAYLTNYAYQPVIKTGRANQFSDSMLVQMVDLTKHEARCIGALETNILINPKLEVYPCCSQVIENTILCMGNLHQSTLNKMIDCIKHNQVLFTVFTQGFTPFLTLLEKKKIKYPLQVTSPCEICEFLFQNDWFLKILKDEKYFEAL
jgi:sulfatase maturation enzyme AslB (radical SAM superfamily)